MVQQLTSTGRYLVLTAAFFGWLLAGMQLLITSLGTKPAATYVLDVTVPESGQLSDEDDKLVSSWFGRVVGAFLAGAAAGGLLFGRIGDRIGRTKALALDMLQNRSATVEITVDSEVPEGEALNTQVKITNTAGHKLPTGYSEGRRMWINVEARDGQGTLIWESAPYNSATGVLTEDGQAKVYDTARVAMSRR